MILSVIGKVVEIKPIEKADRIQQAIVVCGKSGKWTGVVGKDINQGDKVLVFLQDAILPPSDRWKFMESRKWRVRMARFLGAPSECVIVPLIDGEQEFQIGDDQTHRLGVIKYVKQLPNGINGEQCGEFPYFIPKTDEPNFQTVSDIESVMRDNLLVARLKYDGSSCTVWNDGSLRVASRNWELREFTSDGKSNAYWEVTRKYNMDKLPAGVAIQFEVVGPKIQGNPLGLASFEGRGFTAYDYKNRVRLSDFETERVFNLIGMPYAEKVGEIDHTELSAEELRQMAQQVYSSGKIAEGVVIRSPDHTVSFKVINLLYKD